jgi:hypothetical protein
MKRTSELRPIREDLMNWIDNQVALAEAGIKPELDPALSYHLDRLLKLKEELLERGRYHE